MKYLVTGGAGYIGSVVVNKLIKSNNYVNVLDNCKFGGESLISHFNEPNFKFFYGDIRDEKIVLQALQNVDIVIHLAAIVGDPACKNDPSNAEAINLHATKELHKNSEKNGVKRFVFASTCSNYGKMEDPNTFCNESSKLNPISLYAETKVAAEKYLMSNKTSPCIPTCLRFSTVYGLSPRTRFDLTVNEFCRDLADGKELVIFGEQFWRPYCHVDDLATSTILASISDEKLVAFDTFNVGDSSENYTKGMLAEILKKKFQNANITYVHKDEDPRDYRVDFSKIKDVLNFKITKTVEDGIDEIIKSIKNKVFINTADGKYRNC